MPSPPAQLVIATRQSVLALWQAERVFGHKLAGSCDSSLVEEFLARGAAAILAGAG